MDGGATNTQTHLLDRCMREADTIVDVACALRNQLLRSGLPDVVIPSHPQSCKLARDPYDGTTTLVGEWQNPKGKVIGSVVIHESGQLFAELDVLRLLPEDTRWLVDAVVAFGTAGDLRSELRLTPAIM